MDQGYTFRISDSYTPSTIPMDRLAQYISALARLLGESGSVHLGPITEGSVKVRAMIDEPAQPKVQERVRGVRIGAPAVDALKAYNDLDEMLREDNASGTLADGDDEVPHSAIIIEFPGKNRPKPVTYGPFKQRGSLDGVVYRIGGADDTKHVAIKDGDRDYSRLEADEATAVRLSRHLFRETVRLHGEGTWLRHGNGTWELKKFKIRDFDVLSDEPLDDVIARLRAVGGFPGEDIVQRLLEDRAEGDAH
ncbi:hypothetical protein [Sphingomonas sanxanigenens]|uniref:Uncharacterized protein n=1 Tax=Sphingomonas sanxanigenens DSM 19645 = NX02 TaxID=1123269 RepID=W0AHS2_9SPHN|nr:hypothetical protein [Sphingomonas sanxanigenens]AHE55555.1 hypothetical protein NX02_19475 [Sphingomonas sanxanigenens DSM 19645 = NX02]AHE57449.1 hypothetical protein NX02_29425 [Sphingomonas sanxanigenens DSM 19645 = NX02]